MKSTSLFSDFLKALGVPHTAEYSDKQFDSMPFPSLFGLSKLLESYGIHNEAFQLSDKEELNQLTAPFIADTPDGCLIVTDISAQSVKYVTQGNDEEILIDEFKNAWNGIVLIAHPTAQSAEPDYGSHRALEIIDSAKKWVLAAGAAVLFLYLFITNGIYMHWSTVALTLFNIIGLILTFMLVQKTLKIKSKAADEVCGVLQEGGCDSVLQLKASSFFGIFKWSEVGFTYFSVSLLTLLIFPQYIGYLALCNACCLPFTVWSIWYQKFRAKVWCTLCVSVQATLWLLFFCYFFGGWYHFILPIRTQFFVLGITYVTVLLGLNRIMSRNSNYNDDNKDNSQA